MPIVSQFHLLNHFSKIRLAHGEAGTQVLYFLGARFGRIDILINNAGIQHISPVHEFDVDKWDHLIAVMLTGPFLTTSTP